MENIINYNKNKYKITLTQQLVLTHIKPQIFYHLLLFDLIF